MNPGLLKVFINGRFLSQPTTGVQRTAREIVRAIDKLLVTGVIGRDRYQVAILAPPNARSDLPLQRIAVERVGWLRGHAWEQLELPVYARGGLLVSFANTGPLAVHRQIVMMHDASVFAVPSAYSKPFQLWYQLLLPRLGRTVRAVLTDSQFSRDELSRLAGVPSRKLYVVPLGKEHILEAVADTGVLARAEIGQRPFILAVGSRSPHKNFHAVLHAVQLLGQVPYDIVFAGGTNARVFEGVPTSVSSSVKELGYVTDGELRTLYERAACFVFPSMYEGFGLPPLEAMACGCPVISSRAASLSEVCGDAALYFDPDEPAELARQIEKVMASAQLRADLSRRGLERSRSFSWQESGRAVVHIIDESEVALRTGLSRTCSDHAPQQR